jgi:endonuclease/exonuclease/phosphatase (EEP) superfamily protein YafD
VPCLQDVANRLFACSAHLLTPEYDAKNGDPDDTRSAQAARYAEIALEFRETGSPGYTTFVGGDLNLQFPMDGTHLQPFCFWNKEADGEYPQPTSGVHKIDYIFADDSQWEADTPATVIDSDLSDHRALIGHFDWVGNG